MTVKHAQVYAVKFHFHYIKMAFTALTTEAHKGQRPSSASVGMALCRQDRACNVHPPHTYAYIASKGCQYPQPNVYIEWGEKAIRLFCTSPFPYLTTLLTQNGSVTTPHLSVKPSIKFSYIYVY